jgi:hypothetical protein
MPMLSWEDLCLKCIYSCPATIKNAKGKCSHKTPNVVQGDQGWECNSFTRRWDSKEDLLKSREEKQ